MVEDVLVIVKRLESWLLAVAVIAAATVLGVVVLVAAVVVLVFH